MAIQNLFRLQFIDDRANVILLGTVGLGNYAKLWLMLSCGANSPI
jgi:hypothetical protein